MTDITNCTDRVLDIFLRMKGGEDGISCETLTVTERAQLADLMKWERTPYVAAWIAAAPSEPASLTDYEGRILDRQDREVGEYL